MKVKDNQDYKNMSDQPKKQIPAGKGSIYLNVAPKSPNSPRYSGKIRFPNGVLNKFSFWFNGTAGQEGFNIGIAIDEVDESEGRPLSQAEQKEGWAKAKATLTEEPVAASEENDDVPF